MRNRGETTDVRFVEPALRTPRSPCNPRGLVWGHTARWPRPDTRSFRHLSTGQRSAGKRALPPCISLIRGTPDPGWGAMKRVAFDRRGRVTCGHWPGCRVIFSQRPYIPAQG